MGSQGRNHDSVYWPVCASEEIPLMLPTFIELAAGR